MIQKGREGSDELLVQSRRALQGIDRPPVIFRRQGCPPLGSRRHFGAQDQAVRQGHEGGRIPRVMLNCRSQRDLQPDDKFFNLGKIHVRISRPQPNIVLESLCEQQVGAAPHPALLTETEYLVEHCRSHCSPGRSHGHARQLKTIAECIRDPAKLRFGGSPALGRRERRTRAVVQVRRTP